MTVQRSSLILGACLGVFLVLLPLALEKPGLPVNLRADEPTYLAMAASLGIDGDLRCEAQDVERAFFPFPYSRDLSFHLASHDGWVSAPYFDREPLFAWVAALPVRFFGPGGLSALNALFLLGILAMGAVRGRSRGPAQGPGLLFSSIFLMVSAAFVQVFWLGSALFLAFLITVAFRLAEIADDESSARLLGSRLGSGIALGLVAGSQPWLLVLSPSFFVRRRPMHWLAGLVVGMMLAIGSGLVLGLTPWNPDLEHQAFTLSTPYETPWTELSSAAESSSATESGSTTEPGSATESQGPAFGDRRHGAVSHMLMNLLYALIEQRTGLLPYFPATLILLGLLIHRRKIWLSNPSAIGLDRWLLGVGLGVGALIQPWTSPPEVGGSAFGNPALVILCPALLFLLRAAPPVAVSMLSVAVGVLTLGPALVSCLGPPIAYAGSQSHTQGAVLSRLPLNPKHVGTGSDYLIQPVGSDDLHLRLWVPKHLTETRGEEVWLLGKTQAELFLESTEPLKTAVFQVRSLASNNRVQVRFDGQAETLPFGDVPAEGSASRLTFQATGQQRIKNGADLWIYPLTVTSERGKKPSWNGDAGQGFFYLGAAIAYLGTESFLKQPLYGAEHLACEIPDSLEAGAGFLALSKLRNTSTITWPVGGAAAVRLGYRWLDADGSPVLEGPRTQFQQAVPAGQEMTSWIAGTAPGHPGSYLFEVDPIFENVSWFSAQGVPTCRRPVEVIPALRGERHLVQVHPTGLEHQRQDMAIASRK